MKNAELKIIFIGTPEFGSVILEKLVAGGYTPLAVVTAPDKPVGRKQAITPPPVKITAQRYGIPVLQPEKILDSKSQIFGFKPDIIIVAAYGQILPREMLDIPKYGCLNVHASLLPKYRGASPIQYAILNGEKETGVSIILMDEGIDTGPILEQRKTEIGPNENAKELHDRLAVLGAELLADVISDWIGGKIKLLRQSENEASYSKILAREDGKLDWKKSPRELERKIRAFNPWPGTYTSWEKEFIRIKNLDKKIKEKRIVQLKILKARLENNKLIIETVQPEGKKPMGFQEFLRGNPDFEI